MVEIVKYLTTNSTYHGQNALWKNIILLKMFVSPQESEVREKRCQTVAESLSHPSRKSRAEPLMFQGTFENW